MNRENRNISIVVEGIPGSGKTTHLEKLHTELSLPLIEEFVLFSDTQWRKFNFKKEFYFSNDEAKNYAANLFSESVILFDRHYASTVAYGYAITEIINTTIETGECYETNLNWYINCIEKNLLSKPDFVIVLDIPPELSKIRQPRASESDPVWSNNDCLDCIREYYKHFYKVIEPEIPVLWIDGTKSWDTVYREMYNYIKKIKDNNEDILHDVGKDLAGT